MCIVLSTISLAYLWTAPELLRRYPDVPVAGTQKADVYSFALCVQEILYRALPYFLDTQALSPKGEKLPSIVQCQCGVEGKIIDVV